MNWHGNLHFSSSTVSLWNNKKKKFDMKSQKEEVKLSYQIFAFFFIFFAVLEIIIKASFQGSYKKKKQTLTILNFYSFSTFHFLSFSSLLSSVKPSKVGKTTF
jgi:predicted membrane channel-forming protein YqfA (hemolysin III family)